MNEAKKDKECKECKNTKEGVKLRHFYNARGRARYKYLCAECEKELCPICGKKLPQGVGECAQCNEKSRIEGLRRAQFEIDHQHCKCGKINDSRTPRGVLNSRFCTDCRKKYGEKIYNLSRKEKGAYVSAKSEKLRKNVVFDKTVGYKYK